MTNLRHHRALALLLLAGVLSVAGCGRSSSPTAPATSAVTQEGADDIAQQALLALDQFGLDTGGGLGASLQAAPAHPALAPSAVAQETTFTFGSMNVSLDWHFLDAHDVELPDYGPAAVKLVWNSHLWGVVETVRDTAIVRHHGHLVFTGIQPEAANLTIDGMAGDTLINRFRSLDGSVTRDGAWRSTLALDSVVQPRTPHAWPASGTLTYSARVDRFATGGGPAERSWSAVVVITFNGTSHPDVVVNGRWHYTWDMANGTMTRA